MTNDKMHHIDTEMPIIKKQGKIGLRISSLPEKLRESIARLNLDKNGDGELNEEEIVQVVDNLASTTKLNKTLKLMVAGLCVFALLLVGCVFGASIAAARLTKDTEVDALTGIMYAKKSNNGHLHQTTMKTEDVLFYLENIKIFDMTDQELMSLKEISLTDGNVKFKINGYARGKDGAEIGLLVDGGTIIYDSDGLATATGDAKTLLDLAYYGEPQQDGRRHLYPSSCSLTTTGSSSFRGNRGSF